jgi:hypothetical protein
MTTNSIRTTGKCSNGGGISSVPFGPSFGAFIFTLVALLAAARSNLAAAEDRGAIPIRARTACMVGHQFEPGPIVGGHNRQPTVREFQARIAQLRELEQRDAETPDASQIQIPVRKSRSLGHYEACAQASSDVRFGSKADIEARPFDVRFTPKSGHC